MQGISFTRMRLKFYADDNSDKDNEKGTILPVTSGLQKGMDDKGYYYFRDRLHDTDTTEQFLDASSHNATIALYDTQNTTLYLIEYDS